MTAAMWRVALILLLAFAPLFTYGAEPWALVRVAVANLREKPSHAAEMGTQVLMGTPLKISATDSPSWLRVETPDGYKGYIAANSLRQMSAAALERWKRSDRVVVTAIDPTWVYSSDICTAADASLLLQRVSDVVNGCILQVADGESCEGYLSVMLPDGRKGLVAEEDVAPFGAWAAEECSMADAIDFARSMTGTTYLWGGTSPKGVDCSGLTRVAFLSQGVMLPRNASQQALVGEALPLENLTAFQPGDLLFFGNAATGRVNHVGISLGNGRFIHSSGRVRVSSLLPSESDYEAISLLGARRLTPAAIDRMALRNHPWYF